MATPTKFVALLRGINLGGRTIKMDQLRAGFESLNFANVKTILASGNVIFESDEPDSIKLKQIIETKLTETFSHAISVIIRPQPEIKQLVESDPFKSIKITPDTKLYVTFLPSPITEHPLRTAAAGDSFKILKTTPTEVFTIVTLAPGRGTLDAMDFLDKAYGKNITTRNWNTVCKLAT